MNDHGSPGTGRNATYAFVLAAYGLSIGLGLVVGLTGGYQSPLIALQPGRQRLADPVGS